MVKIEKKVSQTTYCMDEAMKSNDSFDYDAKINELRKINERLEKLEKFIDSDSFASLEETDRDLLNEQLQAMHNYLGTLSCRMKRATSN